MHNPETMTFINPTDKTVSLSMFGLPDVPPGKTIDLPLALCAPGRADNGSRSASSIEQVAPQLQPHSEIDKRVWSKAPTPPPAQSKIVSVRGRMPQEAAGVKALREARARELEASQAKAETPKTPQKSQG